LATGKETTILELATLINELTGNNAAVDLKPARDWDRSGKRFASVQKASDEILFRATVDIRSGIRQTIEWTRANLSLIQRNIMKHNKLLSQV
jgi:nucleoside-diphosphate-sugar epimerase